MKPHLILPLAAVLGITFVTPPLCPAASSVPDLKITELQGELRQQKTSRSSTTSKRRSYKNIVRKASTLVKSAPTAPNRFRVLAVILEAQKQLLTMEASDRTREALFETCSQLAEAPDEFAHLRLEADMLLSEKELTEKGAEIQERVDALAAMIKRYRDTPAEAKSLMMAARIAPKLNASSLQGQITAAMDYRFSDDHEVIEFRRKYLGLTGLDVLVRGSFTRADGAVFTLPEDRAGQPFIMVFWSQALPESLKLLTDIKTQQALAPHRFDIFSFNLDALKDAGQAKLKELGLKCHALRLPGGKHNQVFRTFAQSDPVAILVNEYGKVTLTPANGRYELTGFPNNPKNVVANGFVYPAVMPGDDRYLAQLQSILIGDFLAPPSPAQSETLKPIQKCFPGAPFRYRLSHTEALANYATAETLSRSALNAELDAPESSTIRNYLILSLMGQWKLSGEPTYFDKAVNEANTALATSPAAKDAVIPRFCLARKAIRDNPADAKPILVSLLAELGGRDGPLSALSAAAVLGLETHSRALYGASKAEFLKRPHDTPEHWAIAAFFLSSHQKFLIFKSNTSYVKNQSRSSKGSERGHIINHGGTAMTNGLSSVALTTLEGNSLTLPADTNGKLTYLMFVEPPPPGTNFPAEIYTKAIEGKRPRPPSGVMQYAFNLAERHIHGDVQVIAAFLSDDVERIKSLKEEYKWPCQYAMVPGGLHNPIVQKLGILSADRAPNVFLVRRDGTIAWQISGTLYRGHMNRTFPTYLALKVQTEVCDTELAYSALAKGDFKEAQRLFSGPFLPERDERYRWSGPRFHGRALANIGLKNWESALTDIDHAISEHQKQRFNHSMAKPCSSMLHMQRVRATALISLKRTKEAEETQKLTSIPPTPYYETIYERFHSRLEKAVNTDY